MDVHTPPAICWPQMPPPHHRRATQNSSQFGLHRAEPDHGDLFFGEQRKQAVELVGLKGGAVSCVGRQQR